MLLLSTRISAILSILIVLVRIFRQKATHRQGISLSGTDESSRRQSQTDQVACSGHGSLQHDTTTAHQYNTGLVKPHQLSKLSSKLRLFLNSSCFLSTYISHLQRNNPCLHACSSHLANSSLLYFPLDSHSAAPLPTWAHLRTITLPLGARFTCHYLLGVKHPPPKQYSSAEEKITVPHWP